MHNLLLRRSKKGFTLMEMLIVVAIIAILVAVSAPMFVVQIEKTKGVVDDANYRAAKQVASLKYMLREESFSEKRYYDITIDGYVEEKPSPAYGQSLENAGKVVSAIYNTSTKQIELTWE